MAKTLKKVTREDLSKAYQKVLLWFFSFPAREIGLSDLAKALKISKTTAHNIVEKLVKEGFLKKEVLGKIWRISCNQSHFYNFSKKISYNLSMIYEAGILEEIHKTIKNPQAIILFGSYRKGDDTEKSDIDIAVEILGNEKVKIIELGIIPQFGFRKNVPIHVHIFSRNTIDLNLFSNIVNGIVIDGFLEVKI